MQKPKPEACQGAKEKRPCEKRPAKKPCKMPYKKKVLQKILQKGSLSKARKKVPATAVKALQSPVERPTRVLRGSGPRPATPANLKVLQKSCNSPAKVLQDLQMFKRIR